MNKLRKIVMIGPSLSSKGGIASVVEGYKQLGLFDSYPIMFVATHVEGAWLKKLLQMLVALFKLIRMLMLGRVAVVHVHVARWNSFWRKSIFCMVARIFHTPYIVHIHSGGFPDFYESDCKSLGRYMVRNVLDHAEKLVVLTSRMADWLESISKNAGIVKIPNFVDLDLSARADANIEEGLILFLGRLTREKGVFDLLNAAALLKGRGIYFKLILAGDGDRELIEREIESLGLDEFVELPGWLQGSNKLQMLSSAQIFVLPSYVEGLPMGILEAMAAGCPVIASRVGGVPDQIEDSVSGILIEPGDITALAESIIDLLLNSEKCKDLSSRAKLRLQEKFSPEAIFPIIAELYEPYLGQE